MNKYCILSVYVEEGKLTKSRNQLDTWETNEFPPTTLLIGYIGN